MRIVLVTGAKGAVGSAVVQELMHLGFHVIGIDNKLDTGGELAQDPTQPLLRWLQMDLTQAQSIAKGMKTIAEAQLDPLTCIHCAGGFKWSILEEVTDSDFDFLMNVNLKSSFYILRELLPKMKKNGFGRIVLIGAKATQNPGMGMGVYAASKAGLNMLVSAVAEEVKDFDISINAVLPSIIDTSANRKDMPDADTSRWVNPHDLAKIIVSLIQPDSKSIRGALIPVAGRV